MGDDYGAQLRDPRWQRRRLEVAEDADWKCRECGRDDLPFHVHHDRYVGRAPWDTPKKYLRFLCEICHKAIDAAIKAMLEASRAAGLSFGQRVTFQLAAVAIAPPSERQEARERWIVHSVRKHFEALEREGS